MRAAEIMTLEPVSIFPDASILEAIRLMLQYNFGVCSSTSAIAKPFVSRRKTLPA